jgi:alpha/beta superfamily hydrolase
MTAHPIDFETADGLTLEARWDIGDHAAARTVVLCHPHPLQGGTMTVPLLTTVTDHLCDAGAAVLRFNFRGVGRSEGGWGGGAAEIGDLDAAIEHVRTHRPQSKIALAGWSFGAIIALRWQTRTDDASPLAAIAPPIRLPAGGVAPAPASLAPAPRLFVVGDRDQFVTADELEEYATAAGAHIEVLKGSDHFFALRHKKVAELVASFLVV